MDLTALLLVAIGGGTGAVLRYIVGIFAAWGTYKVGLIIFTTTNS